MERSAIRDRTICLALFACAAALRLIHVATVLDSPFFTHLALDPLAYDEWGMRIAAGSWLGDRIFYQDPLYPYFLGVLYTLLGHAYTKVVVVQALLGSLVPPLVYAAARTSIGRGRALTAAVLALLYAPAIYYEALILKSWMEAFFLAVALWLLSRAIDSGRAAWWLAAGASIGLGCLVRANFLLFLPLLAVWCWLDRSAAPQATRAGRLRCAAALLAGGACILVPTAVRNRIVGGEWVLTTSQGGQNFFLGNNAENKSGEYEALPFVGANPKHEERGFAAEAERRSGRPLGVKEVSRFWFAASFAWIREQPGDWLWLMGKKTRVFWSAYEVPDNLDYYAYQADAPVLRLPLPGFGFLAPLGIVGAALWIRRTGWARAVLAILVVYSSSVIFFYVFARYRLGLTPALFPLAGSALCELWRVPARLRNPDARKPALLLATGAIAAFAFVNLPVRAPADYWSHRLAAAVGLPVQDASTAMAHFNLGVTYAREAKEAARPEDALREAEAELREAVRQEPWRVQFRVELGKVLARQSREREAIEQYEAALRIEPADWRTWHALGILHRRSGDAEGAERSFRRAAELAPGQTDSLVALGELLVTRGRKAEAVPLFESALRISPANEAARRGLQQASK